MTEIYTANTYYSLLRLMPQSQEAFLGKRKMRSAFTDRQKIIESNRIGPRVLPDDQLSNAGVF